MFAKMNLKSIKTYTLLYFQVQVS